MSRDDQIRHGILLFEALVDMASGTPSKSEALLQRRGDRAGADGSRNVAPLLWRGQARLGEGPLWDSRIDTLCWGDILPATVFAQPAGTGRPTRLGAATRGGWPCRS